jgi:hypothetical protein
MTWSRTAAGTAILAGLVITGATIWQGATRQQVATVDWLEIVEAYQERAAAVYVPAKIRTNSVPCYAPEARTYIHHWEGTNAVYTNYLSWVSNAVTITTNWWVNRENWWVDDTMWPEPSRTNEKVAVVIGRVYGDTNVYDRPVANFVIGRQFSREDVQDVVTNTLALIPKFIDHTKNSNDNYQAYFSSPSNPTSVPALTVTGVFARLQVGNLTNLLTTVPGRTDAARTNWVYAYTNWWPSNGAPHAVCYTGSEWHAVSLATNWTATNGYAWAWYSNAAPLAVAATNIKAIYSTTLPAQVYTNTLIELAKILAYLKDTATTNYNWTNTIQTAEATNIYTSGGPFGYTWNGYFYTDGYGWPAWGPVYDAATNGAFLSWEDPGGRFWTTNPATFDDAFITPAITTNSLAPIRAYTWWWDMRHIEILSLRQDTPSQYSSWYNTSTWYDDARFTLTNRASTLAIRLPQPGITNVTGSALLYLNTYRYAYDQDSGQTTAGYETPPTMRSTNWISGQATTPMITGIATTNDLQAPTNYGTTRSVTYNDGYGVNPRTATAQEDSRRSYYPDRSGNISKTMSVRQCILSWQFRHCTNSIP